jgi:hypothetical protein
LSSLPQAFHVTAHYYFISILLGTSELSKPHQPGSEIAKGGGEIAKVPDQTEATVQSLENTIPCPVFCPSRLEGSMRLI